MWKNPEHVNSEQIIIFEILQQMKKIWPQVRHLSYADWGNDMK